MVQLSKIFALKEFTSEPISSVEENCLHCCLSDLGCDQLFDIEHNCEPCISLYLLIHKTTLEEALKHTGYLIFKR